MGRPGYYTNPQYALVLTHPKTKVHVELKAPKDVSRGLSFIHHHPFVIHNLSFLIQKLSFSVRAVDAPVGRRVWR